MRVAADLMELSRVGGCPMAKDDLTGNMPTEKLLSILLPIKKILI
jgi:hypothetical protein